LPSFDEFALKLLVCYVPGLEAVQASIPPSRLACAQAIKWTRIDSARSGTFHDQYFFLVSASTVDV